MVSEQTTSPGDSTAEPSVDDGRLAAVERRLDALEAALVPAARTAGDAGERRGEAGAGREIAEDQSDPVSELDPETFWALRELDERADSDGAVLFAGSVHLANGERYLWQQTASSNQLLDLEWQDRAQVLTALGHPVRLRLLQLILLGVRTTAEIGEVADVQTSGQLHHHLKELVHAGWLTSPRRGSYRIPPERVVPLLSIVQAAGPLS